jgi:predicted MFS family arabinose efflux permease
MVGAWSPLFRRMSEPRAVPHPLATAPAGADPIPVAAIAALALAAMASGMSMRHVDPLLPRLARDFGIPLGQASQAITAFAIAYGVAQLMFGPLGDRYGKYRVVAWACAASALTSWLCALAPGHAALVGARLLAGATAAAVIPLSMAWIGDAVPYAQRQPVLAKFLIGQIAGLSIGVWLGGYAAEHWHWRTPFAVVGAVFLSVAIVLQAMRRRLPPQVTAAASAAGTHALARMAGEFRAVLARPWTRVVLLTVFLEGVALWGPFAFVPAHLHLRLGLPLSTAGALMMLFALGGLGFALGSSTLVPRLGEPWLIRCGAGAMTLGMLGVATAPDWLCAVPACFAMGLGFYMMHNTLQTNATQMAAERRGAAVAAFASSFFLGQSTGVALCGLLVGRTGTGPLIAGGALLLVAVGWNFNRMKARLPVGAGR